MLLIILLSLFGIKLINTINVIEIKEKEIIELWNKQHKVDTSKIIIKINNKLFKKKNKKYAKTKTI